MISARCLLGDLVNANPIARKAARGYCRCYKLLDEVRRVQKFVEQMSDLADGNCFFAL